MMRWRPVLWSGGFDSTALVLRQLAAGERIEPVYFQQSDTWQKQVRERDARDRIVAALPADWRRRLADVSPGESSPDLWDRYWRDTLPWFEAGGPDEWRQQDPGIVAAGLVHPGIQAGYVADDGLATNTARQDWLRSHGVDLPILGLRKVDLLAEATRGGWDHLLRITWSCEAENEGAVHGPCGRCEPCRHRIVPAKVRA